jgi:senataxin
MMRDQKQVDMSCNEGGTSLESTEPKSECNGDMNSGLLGRPRRLNSDTDISAEVSLPPIPRQSSWKQPTDSRQTKNLQVSNRKPALSSQNSMDPKLGNKKYLPPKKQTAISTPYQDTSVERLIREVTNEKFWHHPGICFDYVYNELSVIHFPLLFEIGIDLWTSLFSRVNALFL